MNKIELPDPTTLSSITKEAINEGKRRAAAKAKEEERKKKLQEKEDIETADVILSQVPSQCLRAAERGNNFACVMRLVYDRDYDYHNSPTSISQLQRVAKVVAKALSEANLRPTLEYGHDGGGVHSWYSLVVHW